jgi:anti-sigma regulatory factor (Ser/Thr protein kinase)
VSVVAGVSERAWSVTVPHHARGAALARHRLAEELAGHHVESAVAADVVSVVSELVGNAARHARPLDGGVIRVGWAVRPALVEVRVSDGGAAGRPVLRIADPDSGDGRGLAIVAALADRWGVEHTDDGRDVWAEFSR